MTAPANTITNPGFRTLLMGPSGTGKTHAIRTLIPAGITPFIIFTENGQSTIGDIPATDCHWHYVPPVSSGWDSLLDSAKKVNSLPFDALTKLPDIGKRQHVEFITILQSLANFTCDRDGKDYGDVTEWGTDRCLVIDSLSGLSLASMNLVAGTKPVKSQADWQVAMQNIENLIVKLCMDCKCHFILIAHVERELDEVNGGMQIMVSTLGKKLAPKIPRFFDDVVLSKSSGKDWRWATVNNNTDLKARLLPHSETLSPDFAPIVQQWLARGGEIVATEV